MNNLKGIYLASYKAFHPNHNIVYQDKFIKRDIGGDMLEVDLRPYDYIIATPPCNFFSRGNYRRFQSEYSLTTMHLLPIILRRLSSSDKPFIVENVRNMPLFEKFGLYSLKGVYVYHLGRHTIWTNVKTNFNGLLLPFDDIQNTNPKDREGGEQVHLIVERWLSELYEIRRK